MLGEEFDVMYGWVKLLGDLTITPMFSTTTKELALKAVVDSAPVGVTINRYGRQVV